MPYRMMFLLGLLALGACSQLKETGRAVTQYNGVMMDSEEHYLGQRRYRIVLRGSSVLFDGQVEQFFRRRAEDYTRSMGCRDWKLLEYKAGIESTLLGARRYADGVVECA
ncbi:hypothetical protein [Chitinimonas sp.]|uniref:hypothetical protein n=1 Tax=Chitinimonas sp. TaxID=1934313 RepID=UPI0035AE974C